MALNCIYACKNLTKKLRLGTKKYSSEHWCSQITIIVLISYRLKPCKQR